MLKRIVFRNLAGTELMIMLEPWLDREDVGAGGEIVLEADFTGEEELIIDVGSENSVSVWSPVQARLQRR